ncbi:MAG TPA: glycoside hydrolase family 92 protein, partial [Draconibacterium sp.]|nr:glycoside hydrolase family 92 protein [Draconibacterium sp.]
LVIKTENNSKENMYVQGIDFKGNPIENCWINRTELMEGGELVFKLGSVPNMNWGINTPPPSMSTEK